MIWDTLVLTHFFNPSNKASERWLREVKVINFGIVPHDLSSTYTVKDVTRKILGKFHLHAN